MERKPEQISRDIAAFERKLTEAGTNEVLKEALNKKLTKLRNELRGGQMSARQLASNLLGARKKVKEMLAKDFKELILRLSKKPEYYFLKKYSKSEIKDDMSRPAKPVGYRFVGRGNYDVPSKRQIRKGLADGTVYYEARPKRSDVSRAAQLAKGGSVQGLDEMKLNQKSKSIIKTELSNMWGISENDIRTYSDPYVSEITFMTRKGLPSKKITMDEVDFIEAIYNNKLSELLSSKMAKGGSVQGLDEMKLNQKSKSIIKTELSNMWGISENDIRTYSDPYVSEITFMTRKGLPSKKITMDEVDFIEAIYNNKLSELLSSKMAKGGYVGDIKRSFIVKIDIYERYDESKKIKLRIQAKSIFDLFEKLNKKSSDISYYLSGFDENEDSEEKKAYKQMPEEELLEMFDSSNGDGGNYYTIIEIKNGKEIILAGGANEYEEEDEEEYAKGGGVSVYNLRKGDKVKTRKGDIETIIKKTGSGSYETIENDYTHSPESLEFVSRPGRKMAKGGYVEGREEHRGWEYIIWYNPNKGAYSVSDSNGVFDGDNNYFNTYDKAKEHAEISISSMFASDEMEKGGEVSVYNLRKGDKVKTRKGDIETIIKKTGSGSYETIENDYTHSPESLEFVSRPGRKMAKGGSVETPLKIKRRLEAIRKSIQNENVSYRELAELQSLSQYIDSNDIELRQAAGIPEFEDEDEEYAKGGILEHGLQVGDEIMDSASNLLFVRKNKKQYVININTGKRLTQSEFDKMDNKNQNDFSRMAKGGKTYEEVFYHILTDKNGKIRLAFLGSGKLAKNISKNSFIQLYEPTFNSYEEVLAFFKTEIRPSISEEQIAYGVALIDSREKDVLKYEEGGSVDETLTRSKIREIIAESGKMKIADVVAYFKSRYPKADMKTVREEAKEIIDEAKKFNK